MDSIFLYLISFVVGLIIIVDIIEIKSLEKEIRNLKDEAKKPLNITNHDIY